MTDKMAIRTFPTAYKLKPIKRAEGGEGVLPVARKLGISRKLLHHWIKAWKAHGPEGLNRKRGPMDSTRTPIPFAASPAPDQRAASWVGPASRPTLASST
jgi:transposase-like protein